MCSNEDVCIAQDDGMRLLRFSHLEIFPASYKEIIV